MTDTKRLRDVIRSKGLKYGYIAQYLGLTRAGLLNKIDGETEFKVSEMEKLSNLLGLTDEEMKEIFFYGVS